MINRFLRSALVFSLFAALPVAAFADGWLYGQDGLKASIYPRAYDNQFCRSYGNHASCHLEPNRSGAVVIFELGRKSCLFEVKNGGHLFKDRWDVYELNTISSMKCRLQYLGGAGNSFNIYPPGK